jgi:hypothetical protein
VVGEESNNQILVNLPVTNKARCVSRNAKTLGLQHLQLPDMVTSSRPPDGACIIHRRTDELLIKERAVSDGQAASRDKEGARHAQSLSCLSICLVSVCRPGQLCNKGHLKIPCCFDQLY